MPSDEKHNSIDAHIQRQEAAQAAATAQLLTLREIRKKFPDAKFVNGRWESRSAHEIVTHFTPDGDRYYNSNPKWAVGVLYAEVPAGGRIYSSRPVDLDAGFKAFCDGGCKENIVDMMRATTRDAEAAHAKYEAKCEEDAKRWCVEQEAKKAQEALDKAQPVRIIGEPVRVTLDGIPAAPPTEAIPATS